MEKRAVRQHPENQCYTRWDSGTWYYLQEKVSDYSFQIVVNDSMDYNYYLHEPNENEWLLMSVYPYEVPIKYIGQVHNDDIGNVQQREG